MKVLMIEDDRNIVEIVSLAFQMRLPEASLVSAILGEKGLQLMESEAPDIVILDLGLPDVSGFDVLERIRQTSSVPVLILTVRGEETDIVKGVELGADDYVVKPFRQIELLARVRALTRRPVIQESKPVLTCGALRFDPSARRLLHKGDTVAITATESEILYHLMKNAGQVVPHSVLAASVWGDDQPGAADSLKVHVNRLRSKLEADTDNPQLILTRPGEGYMIVG